MQVPPKISVIVPVYRAEKYLKRCVDSILSQTFEDFELLLIDDGRPDMYGVICDDYARIDSRVRVIHQPNRGVSYARQVGVDNAIGEYLIHADPDDWVDVGMLENLYKKAVEEEADMVICDYWLSDNREYYIRQTPGDLNHVVLLKEMLGQRLHGSCCNKLVRKQLFCNYDINFPLEINRWEDLWVNCSLLRFPIKVSYLPKAYYHYDQCINSNSIVRKITKNGVESQINFCKYFTSILDEENYVEELYMCKASTKELMLRSRLYNPQEIIEIFSEVNDNYIRQNYKLAFCNISKYPLCLVLKGYFRFGCFLDNVMVCLDSLKTIIKRKLNGCSSKG